MPKNSVLEATKGMVENRIRFSSTMAMNERIWPFASFLGVRQASLGATFLAEYAHIIPKLKAGAFTSEVRIETPFTRVAEFSSSTIGYSAQGEVRDFFGKAAAVRMYLGICCMTNAPPNAVKIKVIQNRKEIAPQSE